MKTTYFDINKKILSGLLMMLGGIGLLLHTLGIIETGINLILILASIALIIYGFISSGLQNTTQALIKKYSKKGLELKQTIKKKTTKKTKKSSSKK